MVRLSVSFEWPTDNFYYHLNYPKWYYVLDD